MAGWIDKLRAKAQDTLNDPEKMAAIKGKVSDAVARRMATRRGGYYGPGMNGGVVVVEEPGMMGYGDGVVGDAGWNDAGSSVDGGWSDSGSPDSGSWGDSGASDSGGWGDSSSSDGGGWSDSGSSDGGDSSGGDSGGW